MQLADVLRRLFSFVRSRRAHARAKTEVAVDWRVFGSVVRHVSSTADLSRGGAFLRTTQPQDVGAPIVLDVPTPRGPARVHARVAWSGARGMGLRFTRPLAM